MSADLINTAFSAGITNGLIIVGVGFAMLAVWPWWVKRDAEERERKANQEAGQIEAQKLQAGAIQLLADKLGQTLTVRLTGGPQEGI